MELHAVDIAIIVVYLIAMIVVGFVVERRARKNLGEYFLGGHRMPWWLLSMSNAASMFDISGTMWLVSLLFVYGLKSVFFPWLWPVFNQIFLMVYLSTWLRRSKAMTGAEWITMRFGGDRGAEASRISVVIFALISVIAFTGYAFVGISKFAEVFLPKSLSPHTYGLIIVAITTLYTAIGGFYGVVVTDLIQFFIKLVCCILLGVLAMQRVSPDTLAAVVPAGWHDISFGWQLDLDWSQLMPAAHQRILDDGYYDVWRVLSDDGLQRDFGQRGRTCTELRHAADPGRQESARSRDDERSGNGGAIRAAIFFCRRHYGARACVHARQCYCR